MTGPLGFGNTEGYNYLPFKCFKSQESLAEIRLVHGINEVEQIQAIVTQEVFPGLMKLS